MWAGTGGGVTRLNAARLHQFHALQAGMPVLADDDVIMHGDAERLGDVDDRFRHLDVGLRRRRIATGVIVHETSIASIQLSARQFLRSKKQLGTQSGDGDQ